MSLTLAFDVYGTLIDTHGVVSELESIIGDKARNFSHTWREKQLEYSFRRGLMQKYQPFSVCIQHSLEYTRQLYNVDLSDEQRNQLLERYRSLPAFDDAQSCLEQLTNTEHKLYAFSNGTAEMVNGLLSSAGLRDYFQEVISVDDIQSFKPNPAVYQHFLQQTQTTGSQACLISSNPFDVIGAISAGMSAAWLQRAQNSIYDPWGIEPTITIQSLDQLHNTLALDSNT